MSIEKFRRLWSIRFDTLRCRCKSNIFAIASLPPKLTLIVLTLTVFGVSEAHGDDAETSTKEEPTATWYTGSLVGDIEYQAGRGFSLGRTGLHVGGFSTLEIDVPKGESGTLELDSINFLVLFEPNKFWRGFMELEIGDLFEIDFGTGEAESEPTAVFERLYGDFTLSDAFNLRAGKFQTPVGRWNLVPAEPFVWTAIEPLILVSYPESQTGGAVLGSLFPGEAIVDYWLYGQFTDSFDVDEDEAPESRSVGGRLAYSQPGWDVSLGASFLATRVGSEWNYLGGLDAEWRSGLFEFTTEFVYQDGEIADRTLWDIYLQGVLEVYPTLNLVARYEHFAPIGPDPSVNVGDLGIAWIPKPFLIFKVTYRLADGESPEDPRGFKAAFSVVF